MQSLMFLGCFDQKLLKKNLLGGRLDPLVKEGLKVDFSRPSKYPKSEFFGQALGVPNKVDKLTCPFITFK